MPSRSTGSRRPDLDGVVRRLLQRGGDRVEGEVRFSHEAGDDLVGDGFAGDRFDPGVRRRPGPSRGRSLIEVDRVGQALEQASTTSGCSSRNAVRTMRWVVTNWPSGHRSASSTSTWPPPSCTSRVAQGSGTQAPSMSPAWKAASVSALSCGRSDVAAAGVVGLEALLGQPGPQGDVLGVAERRGGEVVPSRSSTAWMSGCTTREAPPEVVPDDDAHGLAVGLGEGVDGRVGADEGGVEALGEERLDGLGAGVEGRVARWSPCAEGARRRSPPAPRPRAGAWVTFGK